MIADQVRIFPVLSNNKTTSSIKCNKVMMGEACPSNGLRDLSFCLYMCFTIVASGKNNSDFVKKHNLAHVALQFRQPNMVILRKAFRNALYRESPRCTSASRKHSRERSCWKREHSTVKDSFTVHDTMKENYKT